MFSSSFLSYVPFDLHSFPTRRSSDLARPTARPPADRGSAGLVRPPGGLRARLVRSCRRSEEHTSELQSRGHLVCRLLLEKKKLYPFQTILRYHMTYDYNT